MEASGSTEDTAAPAVRRVGAAEIEAWLIERLAASLSLDGDTLDVSDPLETFGLASADAVGLSGELGEWLGRDLSPTLVWEYPSIASLARYLAQEQEQDQSAREPDADPPAACGDEPLAVIGIGCRFPGASGPDALWRLLRDGVAAVSEIPPDRPHLLATSAPEAATGGTLGTRWGGFLPDVDRFDAGFFTISPREAARLDPQQRLLLEVAWESLEDAGIVPERLAGSRTGVYVGISSNDYGQLQLGDPAQIDAYAGSGNAASMAASRLAYFLDLKGPNLAVDTACSSSLVALHLACQSLRSGESDMALVAGVNLILTPAVTIGLTQAGMIASDGRCKPFDARADGYVRSEGAGVVVLKPLARAVADGDPVYAVIRGSAVNHDGRGNGLLAPSRASQEAVLRAAYRQAGVAPGDVQYIEAQGTGTSLGDQIEALALGSVVAAGRSPDRVCLVGSLKPNIGHLEAASGVAGLIKVALALRHEAIPPHLHFEQPNPHIPFDDLSLRVPTSLMAWPEHDGPALAGVSAFGFGGTNAHVVLSSAPAVERVKSQASEGGYERAVLLPISARTPEALRALAAAYRDFLVALPGEDAAHLRDIAYTASLRRAHFHERLAVVGATREELVDRLTCHLDGATNVALATGRAEPGLSRRHKLVFVCSGHDAQALVGGAGRELLATEPVFRQTVEECDRAFAGHLNGSIVEALASERAAAGTADAMLIEAAQFTVQLALAALWRSWGIEPDALAGHGLGEVAAACIAGALSLEDAARVVAHRGRLSRRLDAGPLPADQAELASALAGIRPRLPALPVYASATGRATQGRQFGADYWAHSLGADDRFSDVLTELIDQGFDCFVELSPRPVLADTIRGALARRQSEPAGLVLPAMSRELGERATMLASLGQLYALGRAVAWRGLFPEGGRHVHLPTYAWQRERYWFEARPPIFDRRRSDHPLLQRGRPGAYPLWEADLDRAQLGEVVPPAVLVDMVLASADARDAPVELSDVECGPALALSWSGTRLQLVHAPRSVAERRFEIFSQPLGDGFASEGWTLHVAGLLRSATFEIEPSRIDLAAIQARGDTGERTDVPISLASLGIERLWHGHEEVLTLVRRVPDTSRAVWLDPLLFATLAALVRLVVPDVRGQMRLSRIGRVRVSAPLPEHLFFQARLSRAEAPAVDSIAADARLIGPSGAILAEFEGVRWWLVSEVAGSEGGAPLTRAALLAAEPETRQELLLGYCRAALSGVLGTQAERIDARQRLDALGLDSLMAMHVKNRIEVDFGVSLTPGDLLLGPTLEELAALVADRLLAEVEPLAASGLLGGFSGGPASSLEQHLAELDALSEDELDALLAEMLGKEGSQR